MNVKMLSTAVVLFIVVSFVTCQNTTLISSAKIPNGDEYFVEVMQETILEMDRRGWSSLKLKDFTNNINLQMYDWLVSGTVTYKNGFLLSIQSITVTNTQTNVGTRTVNGEQHVVAQAYGYLNLNDVELAYDVVANLTDGVHHYTGTFTHTNLHYHCTVEKNMNLNTTSASVIMWSLSGDNTNRMYYLPIDDLSEVLSREFKPYQNWDGVEPWGKEIIAEIMDDVANMKKPFPDLCFNQC